MKYLGRYLHININRSIVNYWFEVRICGIGIDINWCHRDDSIDQCTGKISAYADSLQRKRLAENWAHSLSLQGRALKFLWVYFGWMRGFTMYPINQHNRWREGRRA